LDVIGFTKDFNEAIGVIDRWSVVQLQFPEAIA